MMTAQVFSLPSGYVKISLGNGHGKFVSFPSNSMVIFHGYVNLPGGNCSNCSFEEFRFMNEVHFLLAIFAASCLAQVGA